MRGQIFEKLFFTLFHFLYVRRMYYGIQFPELFLSEWPETFFMGILDLLKYKSIKKKCLWFCDSVTLWFCHFVIGNIPNKVSIPKYYPIITKFCTVVHLGGISRWFFVFFEFPIFTPPGGTLVFFRHTKISKFPQISSNLHEIWYKSVSIGSH